MKRFAALLLVTLLLSATPAGAISVLTPSYFWGHKFNANSSARPSGVATDAIGDVIVCGYFLGTVNFGGSDLTSAGGADVFVAAYKSDGTYLWSKRYGGT